MLRVIPEIQQDWTLADIVQYRTPPTWEPAFQTAADDVADVSETLAGDEKQHGRFYPEKRDLFRALDMVPLNQVRVIIVGQDPYPDTNANRPAPRATGLAFSEAKDDAISSSLKTVFKELKRTVPGFIEPTCGDLTSWALQGVLLLNKELTVRPGQPGSHRGLWDGIVNRIVQFIAQERPQAIFALWGAEARKLRPIIGSKHTIFEAAHPSGRAAGRYAGSNNFNLINEALRKQGQPEINWNVVC